MTTKGPDPSRKDWRKVVGMFRDSEFMRQVDEECLRTREAEREAALTPLNPIAPASPGERTTGQAIPKARDLP